MKHQRTDFIYTALLVIFSVSIWLPSRFYPLFWDSAAVISVANSISAGDWHNASLFPALLALLWQFFGSSPTVGHYLTLPFLPLLLISSYYYIKSRTNREFGLIGAAMIGFTPVVLAEYVNVYLDLPMAALVATSLVLWDLKKYPLWTIFYAAAVLTKLPALIVAPYFFLKANQAKDKTSSRLAIAIPTLSTMIWFSLHPNALEAVPLNRLSTVLVNSFQILLTMFTSQGKWLFLVLVLISLLARYFQQGKSALTETFSALRFELIPITTAIFVFSLIGEYNFRSSIFLLIFIYALGLKSIYLHLAKNPGWQQPFLITSLGILFFFVTLWRPTQTPYTRSVYNPPDDLGITDYIQVFRWLASYTSMNTENNLVYYGGFPENISLLEPKMGFVDTPIPFKPCDEFTPDPNLKQVIIFHPFSPTSYPCFQIIQSQELKAYSGTEVNGKWLDLYATP